MIAHSPLLSEQRCEQHALPYEGAAYLLPTKLVKPLHTLSS